MKIVGIKRTGAVVESNKNAPIPVKFEDVIVKVGIASVTDYWAMSEELKIGDSVNAEVVRDA